MNNIAILAKENHGLRAVDEKQQQKRKRSNRQIAYQSITIIANVYLANNK